MHFYYILMYDASFFHLYLSVSSFETTLRRRVSDRNTPLAPSSLPSRSRQRLVTSESKVSCQSSHVTQSDLLCLEISYSDSGLEVKVTELRMNTLYVTW